ncbi:MULTISPECIES: LacI family DNA-binding transcriptional regulator [Phyllobacteriaceae]|uniref:LacI family transcriptional regulator n=1 Tax=Mesorhizobium hungaricum TaxID=1566387 RepID=A0A1C2E599_9HYPH|nr:MULTISPECIES: LacI family DNA-binding transcriptional regulator [Mesorhizobium]MBN9236443.1 LacI family DNA-binding transcriptional regulator [Mesorhizobium sp.]MDQ0329627.1 LacI family transcriptional regulator [Mesorhizobium sp. YL-MeA3-2017]OCX22135.1 LacI family transcriptional regulator [Mesorhizobium hungaricum]
MVNIKDVARRAGVSVGTVSRVMARNETVGAALREKVEATIREMNFKPNHVARGLRRRRTDMIGLVIPDITNPFFAELAKHVEAVAFHAGLSVLLSITNDDPKIEVAQIESLLKSRPTGLIVVPIQSGQSQSWRGDTATVVVDRRLQGHGLLSVDHHGGAALAAEHLIGLGHRHIAYIAGPADAPVSRARRAGFVEHLEAAGIKPEIIEGHFDYVSGEALGRQLLDRAPAKRPTAIATANDQQAIGLLRAASDLGIKVPDELSVIGFDDIPLAGLITPRLTTIGQPVEDIAKRAVAAAIAGSGVAAGEDELLSGVLVVRNSTAPVGRREAV